jgi:hypothetical protein
MSLYTDAPLEEFFFRYMFFIQLAKNGLNNGMETVICLTNTLQHII